MSQQMKLKQQLQMTPQLQQAIRLLQLSKQELQDVVLRELLDNPYLEERDPISQTETLGHEVDEERRARTEEVEIPYEREATQNEDWSDYIGDFSSSPRDSQQQREKFEEEETPAEVRYAEKTTLEGHLRWQLYLSDMSETEIVVGETIIGNLSSSGYLQASIEEIANMCQVSEKVVYSVLKKVQFFDPVGVAARNPQECLLVQVEDLGLLHDTVLVQIIRYHLEDIEANRLKPLLKKFKITEEELRGYIARILSLNPMPGASFGSGEPSYISPDVYVRKVDNEFIVSLNDEGVPNIEMAAPDIEKKLVKAEDKKFCLEKKKEAEWLIQSIAQRNDTLLRVMQSIVVHQHDFFESGASALKPLILKTIAEDVNVHESTVSRITTNKYVSTPHGLFEIKYFFNSAVKLADGGFVGAEGVKSLIKKLISEENPASPLSDDDIEKKLKEELGIDIARRTVAKYRGTMNIPSSSKRKKSLL